MNADFTLTTKNSSNLTPVTNISFEQAKKLRDDLVWEQLGTTTLQTAIEAWLSTLSPKTKLNYQSGLRKLEELRFLDSTQNLQSFALVDHENIIDRIKQISEWSECSRQARAACYISLTGFLARRTKGMISKAIPNKEGTAKTFFKTHEKVKTSAISQAQWIRFLEQLDLISPREGFLARVILQGAKRVSEALSLQVSQIDWERNKITFTQSKTKGLKKETVITYPENFMKRLKEFIGQRTGLVFVSRFGKSIDLRWVAKKFSEAGKLAGIATKMTPHVLRASAVTYLKQQGFADSDIMKITGHANAGMVHAYDKSPRDSNATEKINLV